MYPFPQGVWPYSTPDHDFNKHESRLPEDVSTLVSALLAIWVEDEDFSLYIIVLKSTPPLWPTLPPGDPDFHKHV